MIGFFIKKSFFDGWDNFLGLLVLNLGYIVSLLAVFGVISYFGDNFWLTVVLLAVILFATSLYSGGVSGMVHQYSNYKHEGWACFKASFKKRISHSLVFAVVVVFLLLCCFVVVPFYFQSFQNMMGMILAMIVVWVVFFCVLALMYYFPLATLMEDDKPLKTLKKCFLIMGDNFGFTLFFALYSLINLALSILLAMMAPGLTGIHLSQDVAIRLLMFKYDYIEQNPELTPKERRHMPWEELLYDEREKVGHRSLKGMIFPWKD